jgi:hypothetical protein
MDLVRDIIMDLEGIWHVYVLYFHFHNIGDLCNIITEAKVSHYHYKIMTLQLSFTVAT